MSDTTEGRLKYDRERRTIIYTGDESREILFSRLSTEKAAREAAERRVGELEAQRDHWRGLTVNRPAETQAVLDSLARDRSEVEAAIMELTIDLDKKVSSLSLNHAFDSLRRASNAIYASNGVIASLEARAEKAEAALDEARKVIERFAAQVVHPSYHDASHFHFDPGPLNDHPNTQMSAFTVGDIRAAAAWLAAAPTDLLNERLAEVWERAIEAAAALADDFELVNPDVSFADNTYWEGGSDAGGGIAVVIRALPNPFSPATQQNREIIKDEVGKEFGSANTEKVGPMTPIELKLRAALEDLVRAVEAINDYDDALIAANNSGWAEEEGNPAIHQAKAALAASPSPDAGRTDGWIEATAHRIAYDTLPWRWDPKSKTVGVARDRLQADIAAALREASREEEIVGKIATWLRDQGIQENRNVDKATARADVRYHQGRAGAFFLAAAAINSGVHLQATPPRDSAAGEVAMPGMPSK